MIDEQAIQRARPSQRNGYMLDHFGSLTREVIRTASTGPIDLEGRRIKMKVTFTVEGGLRGVESAVLDQIANVIHGAEELNSTISLGSSGSLHGDELRIETFQTVPQTAGDATLVEIGGRLSAWLLDVSSDRDVPTLE